MLPNVVIVGPSVRDSIKYYTPVTCAKDSVRNDDRQLLKSGTLAVINVRSLSTSIENGICNCDKKYLTERSEKVQIHQGPYTHGYSSFVL